MKDSTDKRKRSDEYWLNEAPPAIEPALEEYVIKLNAYEMGVVLGIIYKHGDSLPDQVKPHLKAIMRKFESIQVRWPN